MKKADAGPKPNPKPNSKSNRSILGITYVVVALFLGLAAYLGYFLQVKSELKNIIATFDIEAKIVPRKKYYVVYIKEGSQIVDILNVMEAPVSLMELENIRIVKEMRGSVNRQVNCETANINKTVSAAVKQIEDIRFIQSVAGLSGLPESLQEMARIRLERPEATLKELGEALEPPVGKSGVNHRLRKLSLVAEELRQQFPDRNTSSLQ